MSDPSDSETAEGQVVPLSADRLYRRADPAALDFAATSELTPESPLAGQARALGAIRFGTRIARSGFNLFVISPSGAGMKPAVEAVLKEVAREKTSPPDWVYVNNFADAHKPVAIRLPSGRAPELRDGMRGLIDDLKTTLPAVFESEDYQTRRGAIEEAFRKKQGDAFSALKEKASAQNIVILRTPLGFALAPAKDGQVIPPEEFTAWPEEQRQAVQEAIALLEKDLERIVHQLPLWEKERRDELRTLNRETAQFAVGQTIEDMKLRFTDLPSVMAHLDKVRLDLIENVAMFVAKSDGEDEPLPSKAGGPFGRYEVNVLVTQADNSGAAPIVEEVHPTLGNLIGRIEYVSQQGVLVTDFRLIKPGALHRANGGYLLIDALSLLSEPFSWTVLKRALRQRKVAIEDVGRFLGLTSTVSLEPDPVPLDVKVVLFGEHFLYYLLAAFDPELTEHFKVLADFEDDIGRSRDSEELLARMVASFNTDGGLKPLDRDGAALLIEHAARLAGHAGKLSLFLDELRDIAAEADFWAAEAGRTVVGRDDVERALAERITRASRVRDLFQERIQQNVALIDTAGARTGQANGLSVAELAGFRFGWPTRITCRVSPGSGRVVDIEREVKLGGPIHSKGVMILSGFLAGRYALDAPMSLFASLVFEQSYGSVEGDSASMAELATLLSALAEVPLRQDIAMTGSINQHGEVQAIGGVNEKIEGFFDTCRMRGLSGSQGVVIPQANMQHLMLRQDVIDACATVTFAVYPVATIDQTIALLTGRSAGTREPDGHYTQGSVNRLVEDRLRAFAAIWRAAHRDGRNERGADKADSAS